MLIYQIFSSGSFVSGLLMLLAIVIVGAFAIMLHEVSHGYAAYLNGDYTAKYAGRLTLNPLKHFDILGTIMMLLVGFGWAKPVPIDSRNFRSYRKGMLMTSLAGVTMNLMLAIVALIGLCIVTAIFGAADIVVSMGGVLYYGAGSSAAARYAYQFFYYLCAYGVTINMTLFLFNLIFIAKLEWGVTGFLLSVMLSDLCSGVMVWFIARHGRYFSFRYLDKELLRVMLRFSLPLIPTAIMWLITGFSDRLFIRHMLSDTAAGVYGAAAKLPNLISMVSTIFFQAWNMSAISENDSAGRSKFYSQVYDAYISILFVAGAGIIAFVKPLSALIINTDKDAAYESAYLFTPMLVVAVLLMCFNQFLSSIYTVSRHTQNSFWTSLVAAVLNLLLNALLIPKFGVHGAIAATFVSYFICYLIRIVDTQQYISFRIAHGRFLINLLILFAMCEVILHVKAMTALWLGLGLVIITLLNLRAILLTARKVLRRN